jgi:hypothetical protein
MGFVEVLTMKREKINVSNYAREENKIFCNPFLSEEEERRTTVSVPRARLPHSSDRSMVPVARG